MIFGRKKRVKINCEELVAEYCDVLERGPTASMTVHSLDELPADKPLMKTALVQEAYRLGPDSLPIVEAAFVQLASFQEKTQETPRKHIEIAAEMTVLRLEWAARTRSLRKKSDDEGAE